MVVIRVAMRAPANGRDALLEVLQREVAASRASAGCVRFELFQSIEEPYTFLLYEEWQDVAAFDAYRSSPEFHERGKAIFPLLDGKPDPAYYLAEPIQ